MKICYNSRAIEYLVKYGYLGNQSDSYLMPDGRPDRHSRKALLDFQSFFGIHKTGEIDEETLKMMAMPRCGVKDRFEDETQNDYYVLFDRKWEKTNLTYKVNKYSTKITRAEVDYAIMSAMRAWESVTNIKFEKRRAGLVDIDISFEKGLHPPCGRPFDGPGLSDGKKANELGHAFYPGRYRSSGDIHMDDTEPWTIKLSKGRAFLIPILIHELGHSLGLKHSTELDSIMAPTIPTKENKKLHEDDIKGIRSLYGFKKAESCASGLSFSWFWITCKIKRDDCAPRHANNLKYNFLKAKCGCQCCDTIGCGPKNYGN